MIVKEGRIAAHQILTQQRNIVQLSARLAKAFSGTADADMVIADFTECDFPGYAQIATPGWTVPTINGSGQAEGKSDLLTFTAGTIITPQTIVAVYLTINFSSGPDALLWQKKLSPTVTIGATGEEFQRYIDLFADDIAALD